MPRGIYKITKEGIVPLYLCCHCKKVFNIGNMYYYKDGEFTCSQCYIEESNLLKQFGMKQRKLGINPHSLNKLVKK